MGAGQAGETHRVGTETLCPPTPVCSQMAIKSVPFLNTEGWSKELLGALTRPDRTQQEQPPEKVGHSHPWCPLHRPPHAQSKPQAPERNRGRGPGGRTCSHTLDASPPGQGLLVTKQSGEGACTKEVAGCPVDRGPERGFRLKTGS